MAKMQRIHVNQTFETSDLYLSAYLLTRGLKLWATDTRQPARVVFVLTPRPGFDDLAAYAEGRAVANVGEFGRALRTLKRALHIGQDGNR